MQHVILLMSMIFNYIVAIVETNEHAYINLLHTCFVVNLSQKDYNKLVLTYPPEQAIAMYITKLMQKKLTIFFFLCDE